MGSHVQLHNIIYTPYFAYKICIKKPWKPKKKLEQFEILILTKTRKISFGLEKIRDDILPFFIATVKIFILGGVAGWTPSFNSKSSRDSFEIYYVSKILVLSHWAIWEATNLLLLKILSFSLMWKGNVLKRKKVI